MRAAQTVGLRVVLLCACATSSVLAQQPGPNPPTLTGTLVRFVPPQTIIVKTDDGQETPVAIQPGWALRVLMPVEIDALPDGTPVRIYNGSMSKLAPSISANHIRVQTPSTPNRTGGAIRLTETGDLDFIEGVPALLKKMIPLSVQIGTSQYRVPDGQGGFTRAPPEQQNSLLNRVIPITHNQTNGEITADYDFGRDWNMAGTNARVILRTPPPPALTTLDIQRTEAYPPKP